MKCPKRFGLITKHNWKVISETPFTDLIYYSKIRQCSVCKEIQGYHGDALMEFWEKIDS